MNFLQQSHWQRIQFLENSISPHRDCEAFQHAINEQYILFKNPFRQFCGSIYDAVRPETKRCEPPLPLAVQQFVD
jgi:hypothetical protein